MPLVKLPSPHSGLSQSGNSVRLSPELSTLLDIDADDYAPMDDPKLFMNSRERRTPPAAAALLSGLGTKNLSLWTVIGAALKSSGFRWWTQAGDGAGLRRRSSRSLWRAFRVPARSRQRHGDTAFRGRCCCDGAGLFIPSQRMPPAHNLASSQRRWSRIQR